MSDQTSIGGASRWTERSSGPPARWYVYIAAVICASTFSDIAGNFIHGMLDAVTARPQAPATPPVWYGLVTGSIAGLIWGVIFHWAKQLGLIYVAPVIAVFSALTLGVLLYELFVTAEAAGRLEEIRRAVTISTALHLAAFWTLFLGIAVPPRLWRREAHRS
ncbi:MAG: hypothetical protein RIA71_08975 [Oceanicaulis sp.]